LEEKWDFNSFFQIVQARIAPSARLTILGISTFFENVSASESLGRKLGIQVSTEEIGNPNRFTIIGNSTYFVKL